MIGAETGLGHGVQLVADNPLVVNANRDFQRHWLHKNLYLKLSFFAEHAHQRGLFLARVQIVRRVEQLVVNVKPRSLGFFYHSNPMPRVVYRPLFFHAESPERDISMG